MTAQPNAQPDPVLPGGFCGRIRVEWPGSTGQVSFNVREQAMHHRVVTAVTCLSLLIFVAGCQKSAPAPELPISAGGLLPLSWSPTDANPMPGIDQAYISTFWIPQFTKSRHPVLLLWFDTYGAKAAWHERTDGFDGKLGDIAIEFHLASETSDDGTVTIAGTDYDTKKGSLFLISTEREDPVVKQLDRSVADLDILTVGESSTDKDKLKALARSDSDISTFFRDAAHKPEAP